VTLIYLIDADNIEYESVNKSTVYTPNFEVPELVQKMIRSQIQLIAIYMLLEF